MRRIAVVVLLAGCSKLLGIEQLSGREPDAPPVSGDAAPGDAAPPDAPPGTHVVHGTLIVPGVSGQTAVPNSPLTYVRAADNMPVASATTDDMGAFRIAVPIATPGVLLSAGPTPDADRATAVTIPLDGDVELNIPRFSSSLISTLAQLGGVGQDATRTLALFVVRTANLKPAVGAVLTQLDPLTPIRYNSNMGVPSSSQPATSADGLAWQFNLAPGNNYQIRGANQDNPAIMFGPTTFATTVSLGVQAVSVVVVDQAPAGP